MKYILVTGGVISGIGKGVLSSSIGTVLKCSGLTVTSIKIDPYLNIDAGTFNPYEHGEVFVLDDGGEVDLDLGNYERFLDITLHRDNNITTGKIYQNVISRERRGDFLGKTVQVVPHVTDTIQDWVERVANVPVSEGGDTPDVCVIELGGTIGDIEGMQFVEAFRQFQFKVGRDNFCLVHVSLCVETNSGEQKTKPTQQSIRELRALGLAPDFIACRSKKPISEAVRSKISLFCHVPQQNVINIYDVSNLYRVPLLLTDMIKLIKKQLNITPRRKSKLIRKWHNLADTYDRMLEPVNICLVGKYTKLDDAYKSVINALEHASLFVNHRLKLSLVESEDLEEEVQSMDPTRYHAAWHQLCSAKGVIVPGGFGHRGTTGKMMAIKWCREKKVPMLAVCLGFQLAVLEFARNVVGLKDAKSGESPEPSENIVICDMPEHNAGELGGTMLLGAKTFKFTEDCRLKQLYGNKETARERHRHRYEVNPDYVGKLSKAGLRFVATNMERNRMEAFDMTDSDHPYFVGVQYHPEYLTRPLSPSPPYLGLLLACLGQLDSYLSYPVEKRGKWRARSNNSQLSSDDDSEVEEDTRRTSSSNSMIDSSLVDLHITQE